ncbi:MAG: hypothetical protein E7252_07015 [Lachnospira sp.]|nr:hypothetical protein [Lachnospira sp.]
MDYISLVYRYQLPNKMFVDDVKKYESSDLFSTSTMSKINGVINNRKSSIDISKFELKYDSIDEIYYLYNTEIELSDVQKSHYKNFIDDYMNEDGLAGHPEEMDEEVRLIFTLYVVSFAKENSIDIDDIEVTKMAVSNRINAITNEDNLFYVSTIIQLADFFDVRYERSKIENYYNNKKDCLNNIEIGDVVDVMNIHYLGVIKSTLGIEDELTEEVQHDIVGCVYYSYTTLSLFYDAVKILNEYNLLDDYYEVIQECISKIDEHYLLEDNTYSAVIPQTPSIMATYCGVYLLYNQQDSMELDKSIISDYLKMYLDDERYKDVSAEELFYIYETLLIVNPNLANDNSCKGKILEKVNYFLNSNDSYRLIDMYCIQRLYFRLGMNQEMDLKRKTKQIIQENNGKEMSLTNYSLLVLISKNINDVTETQEKIQSMENEIHTIMDMYYYLMLCDTLEIKVDKKNIGKELKKLRSEDGYYISSKQKECTLFSLYLGYNIESMLNK